MLVGVILRCVGLDQMSALLEALRRGVLGGREAACCGERRRSSGSCSWSDRSEALSLEWRRLCCEKISSEYLRRKEIEWNYCESNLYKMFHLME